MARLSRRLHQKRDQNLIMIGERETTDSGNPFTVTAARTIKPKDTIWDLKRHGGKHSLVAPISSEETDMIASWNCIIRATSNHGFSRGRLETLSRSYPDMW